MLVSAPLQRVLLHLERILSEEASGLRSRFDTIRPICKNPAKDQLAEAQVHKPRQQQGFQQPEQEHQAGDEEYQQCPWGAEELLDEGYEFDEEDVGAIAAGGKEKEKEKEMEEARKEDRERRALLMLVKDSIRSNFGL